MHVKRVKLKNLRGFRNLELDFTRPDGGLAGWTVVAGRNGSGKSTFLRTIALAISGPTEARTLVHSFANWIRQGEEQAEATVFLEPAEDDSETFVQGDQQGLLWERSKGNGPEPRLWGVLGHEFDVAEGEADFRGPWTGSPFGWFLAGYGPYRRLTGHATDAQRLMSGPDRVARIVSLFREDSSLIECVSWLREIYLRRLEGRAGAAEIEEDVLAFLNDGLLPDGLQVEKIDSEGLWVLQQGVRLSLNELSDGYRTMAALVMDILRHLYESFPDLEVEVAEDAEGTFQRVSNSGVVLIDEIDLHLHVSWQKRIGFWLKRHFPNIQFIVTTHSPFVCQAADPGGLIRLPAPGEDRPAEQVSEALYNTIVNGGADDAVLSELFGLETSYSAEAEQLRERIAQLEALLQSGKAKEKDRNELKDLRSRLPQNLTTDVEQALLKLAINE